MISLQNARVFRTQIVLEQFNLVLCDPAYQPATNMGTGNLSCLSKFILTCFYRIKIFVLLNDSKIANA